MPRWKPRVAKLALKDFKRDGYARQPSSENDWDKARALRLKIDHKRCAKCGSTDRLQVHHVIPRSKGGSNSIENLLTECFNCHEHEHSHLMKRSAKKGIIH
jgi:5-methylcytosine-specific restriction endonuclease McrA